LFSSSDVGLVILNNHLENIIVSLNTEVNRFACRIKAVVKVLSRILFIFAFHELSGHGGLTRRSLRNSDLTVEVLSFQLGSFANSSSLHREGSCFEFLNLPKCRLLRNSQS
jgi:hypothetical protein